MSARSTASRPYLACLIACIATVLAVAPSALGIDAPSVSVTPVSPTNGTSAVFTWSGVEPDPANTLVGYEGGLDATTGDLPGSSATVLLASDGTHTFRVRAVQRHNGAGGELSYSAFGTAAVVRDTAPPAISARLVPAAPNGDNGWYRNIQGGSRLVVNWACSDGTGIASCPPDEAVNQNGANQTRAGTAVDAAGNRSSATSPVFKYDALAPNTGVARTPSPGAKVAAEPVFTWSPATGAETSGFNRYEILVRVGSGPNYQVIARVPHNPAATGYSGARDPSLRPQPLPENQSLRWYVRTIDNAGNAGGGVGQSRTFTIDSTIPRAPTITGGPSGPTNNRSPNFTWTGDQPAFTWAVSVSGTETSVQAGAGTGKSVSLQPLPDGDYTFRVAQVTAFGAEGAEITRSFIVDTVPPAAPTITTRPVFPTTVARPVFAWTLEPGAISRWRVIGSGGAAIQSSDTPLASVTLGPLAGGAYSFSVEQIDVAGNRSPATSDPFSIARGPLPAGRTSTLTALPKRNAARLRPKAGKTLVTLTPVLRWRKGPTGTTLYNLQVFRVVRRQANSPLVLKKVHSGFPRSTQSRVPKKKLKASTCYVWRVWPFVGNHFTSSPLGISNFCTASAKKLRKPGGRR